MVVGESLKTQVNLIGNVGPREPNGSPRNER